MGDLDVHKALVPFLRRVFVWLHVQRLARLFVVGSTLYYRGWTGQLLLMSASDPDNFVLSGTFYLMKVIL
jgi:hypothetical protein